MPFKVWVPGEEVLAADFNTYMQQQVVAVFATAAARDAAITAPINGQTCYLQDAGALFWWNGTAWVSLPRGHLGTTTIGSRDAGPGANVVHASVAFTLGSARRVRADAVVGWSAITAALTGTASVAVGFDGATAIRMAAAVNAAVGQSYWGSGYVIANLAAGAHTADMTVLNASTGGSMRITAGNGSISATDIGS